MSRWSHLMALLPSCEASRLEGTMDSLTSNKPKDALVPPGPDSSFSVCYHDTGSGWRPSWPASGR